jgi:hypothetical protein
MFAIVDRASGGTIEVARTYSISAVTDIVCGKLIKGCMRMKRNRGRRQLCKDTFGGGFAAFETHSLTGSCHQFVPTICNGRSWVVVAINAQIFGNL